MIGAGGLLWCLEKGIDVPGRLGLAGFNGVELLDGLPRRLATMDRLPAPESAAPRRRSSPRMPGRTIPAGAQVVMKPSLDFGDTLRAVRRSGDAPCGGTALPGHLRIRARRSACVDFGAGAHV